MLKNISLNRNIVIQTAILLLGAVLFLPGLGSVHLFDWDEINFAESAREMISTVEAVEDNKYGMYMLDKELAARVYNVPSPLATAAE